MKTRKRTDDADLTPEGLEITRLKTQIEELRARVSELEDWFARCTCKAAARAGRDLATAKQLAYLHSLASRAEVDVREVCFERYGVTDPADLSVERASELINLFQPGKK